MKARVRNLVREVLAEMGLTAPQTKGPRVLVIYHTGLERLNSALEQVALIEAKAEKASFFQGPEARAMMCADDIKDVTGARCSLNTAAAEGLLKVMDRAEVVILPTLSLKVAARVANLTTDCQGSELVMNALLKGKKVLAANDGFIAPGVELSAGLSLEIDRLTAKLSGFGLSFCPTAQLATVYESLTAAPVAPPIPKPTEPVEKKAPAAMTVAVEEKKIPALKLVTARDVTNAAQDNRSSVTVAVGGLITPLARDMAKEYSIKIVLESA